jgi:hypothetical protein
MVEANFNFNINMPAYCAKRKLFSLNGAKQREFAGFCEVHRLFGFGFGDLVRVNAGDADALVMDLEHDGYSVSVVAVKNVLKNENDEFHRSEIVVVQQNFEQFWLFKLGLALGQYLAFALDVGEIGHRRN